MNWILALCIGLVLGPAVAVAAAFAVFVGMLLWRAWKSRGAASREGPVGA